MPVEKNFRLEGIHETWLRNNSFLLAALTDVKRETPERRTVPKATFFPCKKMAGVLWTDVKTDQLSTINHQLIAQDFAH
jgi:hypothetical protein